MITTFKEHRGHKFKRKGKIKVFWCVPRSVSTTMPLMDTGGQLRQQAYPSEGKDS